MKRHVTLLIITAIILSASVSFSRQGGSQPVEFEKISDRLFQIKGGSGANGGAYIGDNGVLVIDSKMDKESVDKVIEGIGKLTDMPIKFLVNTHADGDHVNGNRYFPESVTFVAHENCRKEFFVPGRNGGESQWKNPELAPFVPAVTFNDKMDLYLGTKKIELWYFGTGHTTGDCVVYFPEEKTAFLGDQIFVGRAQLIHSYKGGNSFEHVKTLTKMLEALDAGKFCSGHSDIVNREQVKQHIEQMKQLQEKVKTLIAEGKTLEEIQGEFEQSQSRLIESIFSEIKENPSP
jgi:glyoxylase-like metal-dependent hydrolase (beta-lactamase superfamily II)